MARSLCKREGLPVASTSEPMVLRSPGADWQITSDGQQETATAVVRPHETRRAPRPEKHLERQHPTRAT
ncbi:DUF5911 domain-containing protein [Saccharothrix sp. MB29]|nr:DUF5911 domain-containing protein [Saccharothrix sp. MB29]